MSAPQEHAETLTPMAEHEVVLRLRLRSTTDEPEGWDWNTLLDLDGVELATVVSSRVTVPEYMADAEGDRVPTGPGWRETVLAQQTAQQGDYRYSAVRAADFKPYEPCTPYTLKATEQITLRTEGGQPVRFGFGATVWLLNLSSNLDWWRVYAVKTGRGRCYHLSST